MRSVWSLGSSRGAAGLQLSRFHRDVTGAAQARCGIFRTVALSPPRAGHRRAEAEMMGGIMAGEFAGKPPENA
jgi:hypothetical protein